MPLPLLLIALLVALPQLASGVAPTGTLRASFLSTNPVQGRIDSSTGAITGPVADLVRMTVVTLACLMIVMRPFIPFFSV